MIKVMEKPRVRLNTFPYNHPIYVAVSNYLDREVVAAPVTAADSFAHQNVEPLASIFKRSGTTRAASKAPRPNARFSPYIVVIVLLAFVPAEAVWLTSISDGEQAIEEALVLVKKGASRAGALLSMASAEAAIALANTPSFEDRRWPDVVAGFKLLLAEQPASKLKRAEDDRLLRQLEARMFARTQKSAKLVGTCAVLSLGCWKTATLVQ